MIFGLLVKKTFWVPNWKGWLIIIASIIIFITAFVFRINPWLSVNAPLDNGYLIIDGSIPDYAIEASIEYFDSIGYEKIIVTGGPVPVGSYHMKYHNYAEVGQAKLLAFEFPAEKIILLSTPYALKDRTYHNALTVKEYMHLNRKDVGLTIFEIGAHARRSRLLYEMAFDSEKIIGILAIDDINFDPDRWWNSSIGFRSVIGELIAYLYVRTIFRP